MVFNIIYPVLRLIRELLPDCRNISPIIDDRMFVLAEKLLAATAVPRTSYDDAVHIATAAIHGMDYLVTWNCSHIANVETRPLIRKTIEQAGLVPPEICTPLEMKGVDNGD